MSAKGKLLITAFICLLLLSAFGILRLFSLRFDRGDVFPPYSSLRSDPLGCKALFAALERLPGLDVGRNFRDPGRLRGLEGVTIYRLGSGAAFLDSSSDRDVKRMEALAVEGNRLVISFRRGGGVSPSAAEKDAENDDEKKPGGAERTEGSASSTSCAGHVGLWGLEIGEFDPPVQTTKGRPRATLSSAVSALPDTIPLNSRNHFKGEGKGWRPVYSYGGQPVVLERSFGRGSIVLLAESYLLSNEALKNDRCSGLLAWLQGAGRTALFDESHLGVYESPGVMSLIRKHRLLPFLLAILATAALYVWKNAVPFVGAAVSQEGCPEVSARDNFSGLVNLLRRNIPREEIIGACYSEWSRTFSREIGQSPELVRELRAIVAEEKVRPKGKSDQVVVYGKISTLLSGFRMR